jgi:hypothetical protein
MTQIEARFWKRPLNRADLGLVACFYCGAEDWETDVSDWIKDASIEGAAYAHEHERCSVWLYFADDALVGVGSVGLSDNPWTLADGRKIRVPIIPYMGVQQRFWGQPPGTVKVNRYSRRILIDLVKQGADLPGEPDTLVLAVEERNIRGQAFYQDMHFRPLSDKLRSGGKVYLKMYTTLIRGVPIIEASSEQQSGVFATLRRILRRG